MAMAYRKLFADAKDSTGAPPTDIEVGALAAFKAAITSDRSDAFRSWEVRATCSPEAPNDVVALNLSNLLRVKG